jgi:hypothetical protein
MRSGSEIVYPNVRQENGAGNVVQYEHVGIDLATHISILAMQAILSRTDGGIFNPDEVADKACLQAEAMLRRMP